MSPLRKKLLVVDNEAEVCNFVKMFFERRGFRVLRAHGASEAVSLAKEHQPHIILLDVRMKQSEDGISVLPKIRHASPQSKVLMTTAVDDKISMTRAKLLGAARYITKPLVLEDLEEAVMSEASHGQS